MPVYSSHRLRKGRYSESGQVYLLTAVVLGREPIFSDFSTGRLLVNEFKQAERERSAQSLAWVVMPDHFHWLIELQNASLGELMRRTKSNAARAVNGNRQRNGPLWQTGYHDRAIRSEEDLLEVARYIVANPVRARLVKRVGDYPLWDAVWL
ncbi:REP-associated tyrosine transposase [Pseudomonas sp. H11T01]|uniref:REP-associated tyrosine transposase n=1 Tax=Pseudomonas sp. H11T01 TaxID=3402749 RepID=UPI003AD76E47